MITDKIYQFKIRKDDVFLASCFIDGKKVGMTAGKTEDEIFDMVADLFKVVEEVKCSWYRRLIYKIFRV